MAPKAKKGSAPVVSEATEDPFVVSPLLCIVALHIIAHFPSERPFWCSSVHERFYVDP